MIVLLIIDHRKAGPLAAHISMTGGRQGANKQLFIPVSL